MRDFGNLSPQYRPTFIHTRILAGKCLRRREGSRWRRLSGAFRRSVPKMLVREEGGAIADAFANLQIGGLAEVERSLGASDCPPGLGRHSPDPLLNQSLEQSRDILHRSLLRISRAACICVSRFCQEWNILFFYDLF